MTDASTLAALGSLAARLDRLARAPQLMLLIASVADGLNAAAAAAAAAAKTGGQRRRLTGSSAGYREQVRVVWNLWTHKRHNFQDILL